MNELPNIHPRAGNPTVFDGMRVWLPSRDVTTSAILRLGRFEQRAALVTRAAQTFEASAQRQMNKRVPGWVSTTTPEQDAQEMQRAMTVIEQLQRDRNPLVARLARYPFHVTEALVELGVHDGMTHPWPTMTRPITAGVLASDTMARAASEGPPVRTVSQGLDGIERYRKGLWVRVHEALGRSGPSQLS